MTRLTILHTNDLHGRVEQVFRIAALAKQIKQEVEASGGYGVLWDAGDAEDTILYESSMTKGRAMMALLRSAGYELEALGNATPIRYGPQTIAGLAEDFGRPLLCANMFEPESERLVTGLEPYTIQQFGTLTVGIIGLTDPMRFYAFFKLHMGDPVRLLPQLIAEVRARGAQQHVFAAQQERVRQIASRVLGVAASPIDWSPDRECTTGNLVADMLRAWAQTDVALTLAGHWSSGLEAGHITVGQLYAACRSTANPGVTSLTGAQLMQFVREGLKSGNAARTPAPLRSIPVGWPHVSGMSVRVKAGESIECWIGGEPLQPDRTYRVAGTDLEFSELIGYLVVPDELIAYEVPIIVPEMLEDYIARHSPIGPLDQRFFFLEE